MQPLVFEEVVPQIVARDPRFQKNAYLFMREALEHTQRSIHNKREESRTPGKEIRHVSGKELLNGIRDYALEQFGPMVLTVFDDWGIRSCADFGEIVFNMVEHNLLAKTDTDSREDFKNGYDFV